MKYSLEQIRVGLNRHAWRAQPEKVLPRGKRGVITSILEEVCNSRRTRHIVLMWCFPNKWAELEQVSSKDLTDQEWYALFCWIQPRRIMKNYWRGRDELEQEVTDIFLAQMEATNAMIVKEETYAG